MGALTSRPNVGVEEVDISVNNAYRYPPKSGNYFSSHFIMGGERFDTAQPEMYLFGENTDLNFLGSRPAPFPYPALASSEPSRTLKALVNIRKESLRFVRVPDDSSRLKEPERRTPSTNFNIEFTFDCDVRCAITIMYFCAEEVTNTGLVYTPRDASMNSETYHYKRGANQQFSQVCHVFDPSVYPEESLLHNFDKEVMPIVIYCIAEEGEEPFQSHATIAVVEKHSDDYSLKPLKQKLFVDGLCYLLQEIYGIENKNIDTKPTPDDDPDDNGAECVICMCDLRDTLILPCRHLCLCNCCADSLRYQANNCPICRAPFRALLQIKALQKTSGGATGAGTPANSEAGENIPAGYEAVSLIEALNGPSVTPQQPVAPPNQDMYVQLPQSATDGGLDSSLEECHNPRDFHETYNSKGNGLEDSTTQTDRPPSSCDATDITKRPLTQMRMSVLMEQEADECAEETTKELSPPSTVSKRQKKGKSSEDVSIRMGEIPNGKEMTATDCSVKKRSKKTKAQSPVPASASPPFVITETSVSSDQIDDGDELTETLSLLDEINLDKLNGVYSTNEPQSGIFRIQSPVTSEDKNDLENNDVDGEELPQDLEGYDLSAADVGAPSKAQVSRSYDGEIDQEGKLTPKNRRSSSKKNKRSNRSVGRQNQSSPCGYDPAPYTDSPAAADDSNLGLVPESQSLPGTPLSHSSAISRSSDASVSSASSTRALIMSHPKQSSTAI